MKSILNSIDPGLSIWGWIYLVTASILVLIMMIREKNDEEAFNKPKKASGIPPEKTNVEPDRDSPDSEKSEQI